MSRVFLFLTIVAMTLSLPVEGANAQFRVGFAKRDITPQVPIPMWGYAARRALPGTSTRDPLFAKVLVVEAGGDRLALIGLDLGRGPTFAMMEQIERAVEEQAGVGYVLAVGSHTHHGPAIELLDKPGMGQGTLDDAVAYARQLPFTLIDAIVEAANNLVDARMGVAVRETDLNRNRHARTEPRPRDPDLTVVRFDAMDGNPIAIMVNFAAHPTIESVFSFHWTSEWPGHMQQHVENELGAHCIFMQGAMGDLSPNTGPERRGIDGFGRAVGEVVVEMARGMATSVPANPSIRGVTDTFSGKSRLDLQDRLVLGTLRQAFFPELMALLVEVPDNVVTLRMDTIVLNGDTAFVGASGELFSDLSNRIKQRSNTAHTLVFGCSNGHSMYVPTLEAIAQGGYGADPLVGWVPEGTGEKMVEKAVENIRNLTAAP